MVTSGKSVIDLAYAAGVIDSDGYIGVSRKMPSAGQHRLNPAYVAQLTVVNTNLPLIEWLIAEFGGGLTIRKKEKPHHKTTYTWRVVEQQAAAVCQVLLPYLRQKRPQAEIVIAIKDVTGRYLGRHGTPRNVVNGRLTGFPMPPEELARREALYQRSRELVDDRRPQRLSEMASRTDEAVVCANGKPLEGEGTETVSPDQAAVLG